MNKKSFLVWIILLSTITELMLVGCKTIATTVIPTITPTQKLPTLIPSITPIRPTSTPAPPYFHFTPPEKSNIHLEFDYPSSWVFSMDTHYADFMIISLGDPRFLTLPTPDPGISHQPPNDFGVIAIQIMPSEPSMTSDTKLEAQKQIDNGTHWVEVLGDYKIIIDGFEANVLECLVDDPETSSLMFDRRTYFMINDQAYEISYSVADKDRGGEFDQGYDYFLNSLKIVP